MVSIRLDSPSVGQRLVELYWSLRAFRGRSRGLRSPPWDGFGEPLNGQSARQRTVDFLIRAFSPDTCIETGTFYGWTARYLASYGVPLYTVEILPGPYHVAKRYLQHLSNVTLICGDSAVAMRQLAGRDEIRRPFLYLDAHWQERVALFDDVRCAFSSWPDALIVIDDFHVPNDPGYGYDIYDGTPFALDHRFAQTSWFRPANASNLPGLFFAGMGTVPGVGVPMVLVSGRLAAERVLAASGEAPR